METTFEIDCDTLYDIVVNKNVEALVSKGGVEGISDLLYTDLENGLSGDSNDLQVRTLKFGDNTMPQPPKANWFLLFFEKFEDPAVIILSIAAIVALAAGIAKEALGVSDNSWIEGVAVLVAVLIVATVASSNDYSKDLQFRKLKEQSSDRRVRVIRGGKEVQISVFDLRAGDLCPLYAGDKVPADGIFVHSLEELYIDESAMTGEPEAQIKNGKKPFLYCGTNVTKGSGKMLVTGVGLNTEWGRMFSTLEVNQDETPLQKKLEDLVVFIGKIGVSGAVIVFIVLIGYYIDGHVMNPHVVVPCSHNLTAGNETWTYNQNITVYPCEVGYKEVGDGYMKLRVDEFLPESLLELLKAFIVCITIVVVTIPEGLPLAVTISLAYSMKQMMDDNNLVRHLAACETMGGATTICSDKTGTLTENRMTVVEGWVAGKQFSKVEEISPIAFVKRLLIGCCCICKEDGQLIKSNKPNVPIRFIGNTTECALLVLAEKLGAKYKKVFKSASIVKKWGFTSDRKRMSVIVEIPEKEESEYRYRMFTKGASEIVLAMCDTYIDGDGKIKNLDANLRSKLNQNIEELAKKGLRTLTLGYRQFKTKEAWDKNTDGRGFEENFTVIAIVAIEDPIRPEVPESVATCQRAGIVVRMVTGDNPITAAKIAKDCGILTDGIVLEGPKFAKMTDDEVDSILPNLQVLARSLPADKHRLVERLRKMGEVVAVTGDGTNDGPALRAADVGLAMGIAGTEVAREAADIIILDDNFASIVKSVSWGRAVYDNIRKFLQFQLTVNVVALSVAFVGAVSDYGTPLNAVQLLWVNLIMDSFAALAFATEKPTPELLRRKPYGRSGKLVTWLMVRNLFGQAVFQLIVLFVILYAFNADGTHVIFTGVTSGALAGKGDGVGIASVHYTLLFNTFVFCQIFNEINSRKVNQQINVFIGLHKNLVFISIIVITIVAQIIIIEFGGEALKTVPLTWDQWLICVAIGALSLVVGTLLRLIPVPLEEWEVEFDEETEGKTTTTKISDQEVEDDISEDSV
eukprot:TRINITY_DN1285_c0_g1_i1.p1 TRINITY_DN1285_c0_g1~~TRINITY_DN1285_c0_g1_i1.p1  ORF type:complete len:1037 (-),score=200.32 TRINITY_DN1285_c0_g1_i1:62-3142(-)